MDNQHKLIKGYRDLSQEEIEAMNTIKELGEKIGAVVETLQSETTLDQHWIAMGKTSLQNGIMQVIRGIAQPTTF